MLLFFKKEALALRYCVKNSSILITCLAATIALWLLVRMTDFSAPSLAALAHWVGGILATFCQGLAERGGRDRAAAPLVVALYARMRRIEQRFNRVVAKLLAGWRPAERVVGARAGRARVRPERSVEGTIPQGYRWLFQFVQPAAATLRSRMEFVLADPVMRTLLAEVPAARRAILPICRMVGIAVGGDGVVAAQRPPRPVKVRLVHVSSMGWREYSDGTVVEPEGLYLKNG